VELREWFAFFPLIYNTGKLSTKTKRCYIHELFVYGVSLPTPAAVNVFWSFVVVCFLFLRREREPNLLREHICLCWFIPQKLDKLLTKDGGWKKNQTKTGCHVLTLYVYHSFPIINQPFFGERQKVKTKNRVSIENRALLLTGRRNNRRCGGMRAESSMRATRRAGRPLDETSSGRERNRVKDKWRRYTKLKEAKRFIWHTIANPFKCLFSVSSFFSYFFFPFFPVRFFFLDTIWGGPWHKCFDVREWRLLSIPRMDYPDWPRAFNWLFSIRNAGEVTSRRERSWIANDWGKSLCGVDDELLGAGQVEKSSFLLLE